LRVQEAELVVQERQLAERQMQELVVAQKRLEDIHVSFASEAQSVWSFLCQADAALAPLDFNPIRTGHSTPEVGIMLSLLDSAGTKISQPEEVVGSRLEQEVRVLAQVVAEHLMMCFQSRDPHLTLEPMVQGPPKSLRMPPTLVSRMQHRL
jgi:hypothetical protein